MRITTHAPSLPPGLTLNSSTGLITGKPTTPGTSNVTVTATDANGPSGSASFNWTIKQPAGWTVDSTQIPTGAGTSPLNGVACIAANDCTAVGFYNGSGSGGTLAEHWGGNSWTVQATPTPAPSNTSPNGRLVVVLSSTERIFVKES